MTVFGRRENESIEEQRIAVISAIQYLKRELGTTNCSDHPQIMDTEDNAPPAQDSL